MVFQHPTMADGSVEECMDEFNSFVATLERFPPTVIAVSMSVHLQALIGALVEYEICSRDQALEYIQELQRDLVEELGEAPPGDPGGADTALKPFR